MSKAELLYIKLHSGLLIKKSLRERYLLKENQYSPLELWLQSQIQ